ncbi:unnamed protein product [Danaus chrysippus]|uniref:(African queen) hypothetical protein n=1 Tax=Danaus chrysippus TaxID=151541 RepID=A0A8J2R0R4_9NEOP|nr:unnamed protein product [Danaus chrysippus]
MQRHLFILLAVTVLASAAPAPGYFHETVHAPLIHPVVHAPIIHSAPIVHHAPIIHSAPIVHHAPIIHSAPIVHHSLPVVHGVHAPIVKYKLKSHYHLFG